ncbi:hypothetical protein KO566_05925 [Flavobacteriaceae bacterium XHP0103]|uniref:hypothetical protein n=1 Tax=Marixanthotalea marina TaxID=2844359 RepID=UPI002989D468|nr:hypothetical protein [Marixanthotalea marina]MBU3821590.1 hypothetical protein [Marixanthotalea marina]
MKFDSKTWNKGGIDWQITETRENMVTDLIGSDTLIGLKKSQVIKLIGKPEFEERNQIKILVRERYSSDIDPHYISYLIIDFDNDGRAIKCYLEN